MEGHAEVCGRGWNNGGMDGLEDGTPARGENLSKEVKFLRSSNVPSKHGQDHLAYPTHGKEDSLSPDSA